MKPSSSTSEASPAGLFDGVLARGDVREEVSDTAWLQAMLDVEAALARAQSRAGLFDAAEAEAIALACRADAFDMAALGRDAAESGNPVVPLVRALTAAVEDPAAARQVHRGATSQDVLDTAAMLVAHRALDPLLRDLDAAASAAAAFARDQRDTLMAGRTLLQHALPITFGFKAAGWLVGLDEAAARLDVVRNTRLAVQLGGAAGTLASLGDQGITVMSALAEELGLAEPAISWHTDRTRIGELAGALGDRRRGDRQDRPRRDPAGPDRGRRGARGRRAAAARRRSPTSATRSPPCVRSRARTERRPWWRRSSPP